MRICADEKCGKFKLLRGNEEHFCKACGKELVEAPKCKCGEEVSQYDMFCGVCGRPLN